MKQRYGYIGPEFEGTRSYHKTLPNRFLGMSDEEVRIMEIWRCGGSDVGDDLSGY